LVFHISGTDCDADGTFHIAMVRNPKKFELEEFTSELTSNINDSVLY